MISRLATKVQARSRDWIFIAMRQTLFIIWFFANVHHDQWQYIYIFSEA